MATEVRTCVECKGAMAPIVIMDIAPGQTRRAVAGPLTYRLPDDRVSFWTGAYPTAGVVQAFMCQGCARIALYGCAPDAQLAVTDNQNEPVPVSISRLNRITSRAEQHPEEAFNNLFSLMTFDLLLSELENGNFPAREQAIRMLDDIEHVSIDDAIGGSKLLPSHHRLLHLSRRLPRQALRERS